MDPSARSALTKPGNIVFPSNLPCITNLESAGGRVVRQPGGHLIFYGPHGRRILATDPDGNPLHECDWTTTSAGAAMLARARFRLDWGQWVGLKPGGLVSSTLLDLSTKPGWQRLRADDLRHMAAQAMRVPLEEVRFFYGNDDLLIDARGQATIRHKKDAFYVLDAGTFDRARFMACMGAMHWDRVDFLPVVELFQSLLPGTGSAAFELIRGLYDDQNAGASQPLPLRYRGIPTYPSEAAYRLFSGFFLPQAPGTADPFSIFMDQPRSHEVTWLPAPDPPRRYFDNARHLCVTIKGETVQKVTLADDPTGLSFTSPGRDGFAPCDRSVAAGKGLLVLRDGQNLSEIPVNPSWGTIRDSPREDPPSYAAGWREFFGGPPPAVEPARAFSAVLLYPEDETEIGEAPSQPFVADHLEDVLEQSPELASRLARSTRVLLHNFDAALTACIHLDRLDRPRDYTVLYHRPEFAQKQAQVLWNRSVHAKRLDWAKRIRLLPADVHRKSVYEQQYDLIYEWTPFSQFGRSGDLDSAVRLLAAALKPGGLAFLVGPSAMEGLLQAQRLRILRAEPVDALPTFRMHRTILPKARLKPGLTLYHVVQT